MFNTKSKTNNDKLIGISAQIYLECCEIKKKAAMPPKYARAFITIKKVFINYQC